MRTTSKSWQNRSRRRNGDSPSRWQRRVRKSGTNVKRRARRKSRRKPDVADLCFKGRFDDALRLMDSQAPRRQAQKRFGLLRAAVLQMASRRKTLEKYLHNLADRFPEDAEVALEVADFYCAEGRNREASAWLRRTELNLRRRPPPNRREVEEEMLTFKAELLARRGCARAAQKLLVISLQRRPYSWRLASSLDLLHSEGRAR